MAAPTPRNIIADAIRASVDGGPPSGMAGALADVVFAALTDDRILNHAMAAVRNHTRTGPDVEDLTDRDLRAVLRVAFGSLKEGQ